MKVFVFSSCMRFLKAEQLFNSRLYNSAVVMMDGEGIKAVLEMSQSPALCQSDGGVIRKR